MEKRLPHVIIIGAGFGGLTTAQSLKRVPVRVTIVDRTNYHLFQPLLYQVAMAGLSPADIASPIRSILRNQKNATVLLAEATGVDYAEQSVGVRDDEREAKIHYDYLVLATGGRTSYFGHNEWERVAPGLKDLDDAVEIRRRVLLAFEGAEKEDDPQRRRDLLTFVVVGGGPTGVELAGAIAELARFVLARDFRSINPRSAEILLLEGGPRILPAFASDLSESAQRQLYELGVKVRVNAQVTNIDEDGVYLGRELIRSATVIWGAGVNATSFTGSLGVDLDRSGRMNVQPDLSLPNHPHVFAIGDMTRFLQDGKPLPGVSPVAMQMGRTVARNIQNDLAGKPRENFRYFDKGNMATIGRKAAIAQIGSIHLSGFIAWMAWLMVHIFFLIGFRNRIAVLFNWAWSYFTYQRGARLITGRKVREKTKQTKKNETNEKTDKILFVSLFFVCFVFSLLNSVSGT
ncbi:MAG: NAD(P)/FAD-dependent oxidoreductase [Acidobacteria bacterium]|nr:NAD(P)/FAD-dependent oxidoreductase [Acidobacteriota bacterium]